MMKVNAASAVAEVRPQIFAGFPASSWIFALRVWLAMLLALYASFWLELDSPSSAALTVAVVAWPTRGQGMEKAGYRLFATVIGVVASIAIVGTFSQTGSLLLAAFGVWSGTCVYVACMLDGNRAYAAALSNTTVALIAIEQIDSPLQVFPTAVSRGATVALGVLAVALVNELMAAPDYHPVLANRIEALYRRVSEFAQGAVRGKVSEITEAAEILRDIAALHPEIASLSTESSSGTARAAAARSAMVDLVSKLTLIRSLAALSDVSIVARDAQDHDTFGLTTICRTFLRSEIVRKNVDLRDNIQALRAGTYPRRQWRAPHYRSRRVAAETAVRAAVHFTLIAVLLVMAGWPSTELCLSLAAVIVGLSATAADPRSFTMLAVFAMPIACLLAGILKYLVLNGVSEFQLLAIGLAPAVIGLALVISLPGRQLSSFGRLSLVFTIAIFAPDNPQSYDPGAFLITYLFAQLSAILVFAAHLLLPPLSSERRIRVLMDEAHRELERLHFGRALHFAPEDAAFRDAVRIDQIMTANGGSTANRKVIVEAMRDFDKAVVLRLCYNELNLLNESPLADAAGAARAALALQDGRALLAAADTLRLAAVRNNLSADPVLAALVSASIAFEPSPTLTDFGQGKRS